MASWKKYFSAVPTQARLQQKLARQNSDGGVAGHGSAVKYNSFLPEVYSGAPNRVERYIQYDQMDLDSEISKAMDTISDFSTQNYEISEEPFTFNYKGKLTETEITLLKEAMSQWCSLNKWQQRLWRMFRNTIKYGDQIFIRDPETFKLIWVDPTKVDKLIVNESKGKEIEQYVVRDMDLNLMTLVGSNMLVHDQYSFPGGYPRSSNPASGAGTVNYGQSSSPGSRNSRFDNMPNQSAINAEHVLHLSLSEGLDNQWPFGTSILESIYKVYKQKDLLEDAILIYRIVRAPERRVFYIDVGSLAGPRAAQYVERIKNEIYQRRIPNRCMSLETLIPLLDGRTVSLENIIHEYKNGKQNWVYSCNPVTGEIVPGPITWAGVTRTQAQVVKLTLDNGKTLIVTPDHKFPILGKGFVEAQNLSIGESFIPFNTREKSITSGKKNTYQQIWDVESKKWQWTHRIVGDFFRKINLHETMSYQDENEPKVVIHHKDNDRHNNNPDNLAFMGKKDHMKYHRDNKKAYWENISDDERSRISKLNSTITKNNWNNLPEEEKDRRRFAQIERLKNAVWMRCNNPESIASYKVNMGASRRKHLANNPKTMGVVLKNLEKRRKITNQKLTVTREMLGIVVDIVKFQTKNRLEAIALCDKNEKLLKLLVENNPRDLNVIENKIDLTKWGYSKMKRLLSEFGYNNWRDFVAKAENYNHKLVSIEWLTVPIDTGTITVDGNENFHDYHTFALDCGIFTKNSGGGQSVIDAAYNPISINEDYYLATNAEGKGTKVETLGGGENLGVIDDLKYFNNKMVRGLGVPSSYLPTGADDGTTAYSDGKVGTAYVQEYRFSKYCQRLQNLMAPALDKEFKMFLKQRGIEIQSNLFELQFFPPQSFSQYRQIQVDTEQVSLFSSLMSTEAAKYVSKRFALKRYLGWTEDEILENETMWKEENAKKVKDKIGVNPAAGDNIGLGGVGVRPEPTDILGNLGAGGEEPSGGAEEGQPGGPPPAGGTPPAGAGQAAGGGTTVGEPGPGGAV